MTYIEGLSQGLIANAIWLALIWIATDAFRKRRILAIATNASPVLKRAVERYQHLQNSAIASTGTPTDFYALHFAILVYVSAVTISLSCGMSIVFFDDDYGFGLWYILLFVLSAPFSYSMGFIAGAIGKVAVKRLCKRNEDDPRERNSDESLRPVDSPSTPLLENEDKNLHYNKVNCKS